ncbi:TetR/AcrR family transcriptional regulator [Arthrobacter pigmenti]
MVDIQRADPQRVDSTRHRRKLIQVVSEQLRTGHENLTMTGVARAAELSVPTAYRYFSGVDDIKSAFLESIVRELRIFSQASDLHGAALFDAVLAEWFRIQESQGTAIINVRSRRGFLQRLREGDPVIAEVAGAWRRPIAELLREHRIDGVDPDITLYFYNLIFDPREINDLRRSEFAYPDSDPQLRELLTRVFLSAVRQWASGT